MTFIGIGIWVSVQGYISFGVGYKMIQIDASGSEELRVRSMHAVRCMLAVPGSGSVAGQGSAETNSVIESKIHRTE